MPHDTPVDRWNAQAASFDEEPDHGLRDPEVRAAWRAMLREALPSPPARILDLGCGTGTISELLAAEGYDLVGVDFAPAMIERATDKRGSATQPVYLVGDAALPPVAGPFDVVLCRHVLWALPDQEAVLRRWAQLLTDDGQLVLIEGHWETGAGLTAAEVLALFAQVNRRGSVRYLPEAVYWGRTITDERYLVISQS